MPKRGRMNGLFRHHFSFDRSLQSFYLTARSLPRSLSFLAMTIGRTAIWLCLRIRLSLIKHICSMFFKMDCLHSALPHNLPVMDICSPGGKDRWNIIQHQSKASPQKNNSRFLNNMLYHTNYRELFGFGPRNAPII